MKQNWKIMAVALTVLLALAACNREPDVIVVGENWKKVCDIEDKPGKVGDLIKMDGIEFSYPSIVSKGNTVFAVYTLHLRQIGFVTMEI